MAIRKERNRRLTDDLRLEPEAALRARKSFSQIRREPGIPRSTARREIMNHREESTRTFYGRRFSPCIHRDGCRSHGLCGRPDCTRNCASCGLRCRSGSRPGFEGEACPRLAAAPYVRNGCPDGGRCRLRKFHHLHRVAHKRYRDTPVTARQGINATRGEPRAINEVPVPALNRGRSVHHAMVSSPDSFGVCERTVYRHVNAGALPVRRHDLPMAVRYKKRSGTPAEHRADRRCAGGRKRELHLEYLAENPGVRVPQVDTVGGELRLTGARTREHDDVARQQPRAGVTGERRRALPHPIRAVRLRMRRANRREARNRPSPAGGGDPSPRTS